MCVHGGGGPGGEECSSAESGTKKDSLSSSMILTIAILPPSCVNSRSILSDEAMSMKFSLNSNSVSLIGAMKKQSWSLPPGVDPTGKNSDWEIAL